MSASVAAVPAGYHTVTPYLVIRNAAAAIDFYKAAFGATVAFRLDSEASGKVMHAEIRIGDSAVMLTDEWPDMGARGPDTLGGSPVSLYLYVEDVDALAAQAVAAGAREMRPVQDQFYGDRSGTFADPFGHVWHISSHKEDVPEDELRRRAKAMMQSER